MVTMVEPLVHGAPLLAAMREAQGQGVQIWPLGQAGVCIRFPQATVYVDLYLSNHCEAVLERPFDHRRSTRAPLDGCEIDDATVIVCTHDHLDHLDVPTMRSLALASDQAVVVAPKWAQPALEGLGWGDRLRCTDGTSDEVVRIGTLEIAPFPVAHELYEADSATGHRFQGYMIRSAGVTVAHVGDAVVTDELSAFLSAQDIDLLCLPINGRDDERARLGFAGNMNAEEAAALAHAVGAPVLAIHHDMFSQNTDAEAVARFVNACERLAVNGHVVPVGTSIQVAP